VNLQPIWHAPGGNPDGIIKEFLNDDKSKYFEGVIESTIHKSFEAVFNNEKLSTRRHAEKIFFNLPDKIKSHQQSPIIILVIKNFEKNKENEYIYNFMHKANSKNIEKELIIKTLILDIKHFISLFKNDKLKTIMETIYDYLPLETKEDKKNYKEYQQLIKNIINK
ncbi:MAG: hypothetical protein ACRC63_01890, partial [Metamycoplasmataceae bacterium]